MSYKRVLIVLAGALLTTAVAGGGCGRSGDIVGETPTTTAGGAGGQGGAADITDFTPCVEVREQASLAQVDMYLLVDKSGSMMNNNKWNDTRSAFTAFFQDANAAGLNVALRFWPEAGCEDLNPDDNDITCDPSPCAMPQVALGPLSDAAHQQALIDLFGMFNPGGATPMSAALEGGMIWARDTLAAAPNDRVVVVLVSDGEPNGCDEDVNNIAAIAADGFSTDGILTYAVGLQGSTVATMDAIATAGGTQSSFVIGAGNAQQDLLDALLAIAGQSVQCTFAIPDPADPNDALDPRLVRVEYTEGGTTDPSLLPHVADASACDPGGGWYYDDNSNPSTVTLCPQTCGDVQADQMASLGVALGCECEVDEDCPGANICVDNHCTDPCVTDDDCPAGFICLPNGRCVPEPGDPCQSDAECPSGLRCIGGQCSADGVYVGPFEAVQGGAFNCTLPAAQRSSEPRPWHAWLAALATLSLLSVRRRRARS